MNTFQKDIVSYFTDKHEILAVYLFGSFVNGKARPESDIDLAIIFKDEVNQEDYVDIQISYANDLAKRVNREVDIVVMNRVSLGLQFAVYQEGKPLLVNNSEEEKAYKEKIVRLYYDYSYIEKTIQNRVMDKFKGMGSHGE